MLSVDIYLNISTKQNVRMRFTMVAAEQSNLSHNTHVLNLSASFMEWNHQSVFCAARLCQQIVEAKRL